ncbi:lipopolysaccharide biosynthesis protein [Microvirga sp. 2MCAF38]|uniref:lipopolysaccharide biosynthesis protein n=1 Tax=Microvirga sp. 2MCAF38 TaxID=3232989 RepID=UPI003F980384
MGTAPSTKSANKTSDGGSRILSLVATARHMAEGLITGEPGRDAARLAFRLFGARAMSVVTLIVAAWFVSIEAFAEFGVYQSVATLIWIAIFLRFDTAIVAAATDEEATKALRLCIVVGGVLWILAAVLAIGAGEIGLMRMQLILFLPVAILARALLRLAFAVTTREGDFKAIGRASLVQSIFQPVALVLFVVSPLNDDAICFALADIVGHASGVVYLLWRNRRHFGVLRRGWSMTDLGATAARWKGLPLYNLPGAFLSLAFVMSPLMITPLAGDAALAGLVAFGYRIFDVPTQIITAASTPIFLHRLRPSAEKAGAVFGRHMMVALIALIGLAYAVVASLIVAVDPWLDMTELADLPKVVPVVAAFQLFVALGAPLNDSCAMYPQQKRLVLIHGIALLVSALAAVVASKGSAEMALFILAAISATRAFALGELLRQLSTLSNRTFRPHTPAVEL